MEVLQYENSRNSLFDIAKGLCICFVVAGHCYAPYYQFYTSFHVLFFFILAGVFFKDKYITTINDLKSYIIKIWGRYAVPYILCNISFLAFYNFFIQHHIITHDNRIQTIHYLTCNDIIVKIVQHCLLISSSEQLCGATWFLKSLFWGLLSFSILKFIAQKINKYCLYGLIIIAAFLVTFYINNNFVFYYFQALVLLSIGAVIKNIKFNTLFKESFFWVIILAIVICFLQFVNLKMLQIILLGFCGFYFVIFLSDIINKSSKFLSKLFEYLGKHTMCILCLHLFAFKFITYLIIRYNHLSIDTLGTFPAIQQSFGIAFLYLLSGICLPICGVKLYEFFKNFFLKLFVAGERGK